MKEKANSAPVIPQELSLNIDYKTIQSQAYEMANQQLTVSTDLSVIRERKQFERNFKKKYKGIKRIKIMGDVVNCIKKAPIKRTRFEILLLSKVFNQVQFFQDLKKESDDSDNLFEEIAKNLGYIQCQPGSIICKEGEPGDLFYIIFSGNAAIYKENQQQKENYLKKQVNMPDQLIFKQIPIKNFKRQISMIMQQKDNLIQDDQNVPDCQHRENLKYCYQHEIMDSIRNQEPLILDYNFKIKELERGDSFGEIALMKDISRSASIVTTTQCELIILEKKIFKAIILQFEQKKKYRKMKFMRNFDIFDFIDQKNLYNVYLQMIETFTAYNQVIYNAGDESNFIYFILEGEFKLSKYQQQIDQNIGLDQRKVNKFLDKKSNSYKQLLEEQQLDPLKIKQKNKKEVQLKVYQKGQFFGDYEFTHQIPREFKIICSSTQGKLLCLPNFYNFSKYLDHEKLTILLKNQLQKHKEFTTQFSISNIIQTSDISQYKNKLDEFKQQKQINKEIKLTSLKKNNDDEEKKQEKFKSFIKNFASINFEQIKSKKSRFSHIKKSQREYNQDISFTYEPEQSEVVLAQKYYTKYTAAMILRQREKKQNEPTSDNYRVMAHIGLAKYSSQQKFHSKSTKTVMKDNQNSQDTHKNNYIQTYEKQYQPYQLNSQKQKEPESQRTNFSQSTFSLSYKRFKPKKEVKKEIRKESRRIKTESDSYFMDSSTQMTTMGITLANIKENEPIKQSLLSSNYFKKRRQQETYNTDRLTPISTLPNQPSIKLYQSKNT